MSPRFCYARPCLLAGVILLATATAADEKSAPNTLEKWPRTVPLWGSQSPLPDGQLTAENPTLTIYRPQQPNGTVIVICPGGGYGGLVTGPEGHGIAIWLARHHITGAVLQYRLPRQRAWVPLMDSTRAIRLIRRHARDWKIPFRRVGIMGFSAGGHLAATTATLWNRPEVNTHGDLLDVSCRPDFAILVYPVVTMGQGTHAGSRHNLLGTNPPDELITLMSAERQVTQNTPPMFLAHAVDDRAVPCDNSRNLYKVLQQKRVAAQYLELPNGGHGLNGYKGPSWDAWQAASLKWLAELK